MISIIKQPARYSPAHNPCFLTVQSNMPVMYFLVTLYSSSNEVISTLKCFGTPDNFNTFSVNLSTILENYVKTPLNTVSSFISSFNSGYLDYYVTVKEVYKDLFTGHYAGASITTDVFTVYNASLSDVEFQYFGYRNYYINPLTTAKFLSTKPSINNINPWSKEFLYFLADTTSTATKAVVKVTRSTGTQVYFQAFSAGANKLHRLNISPKNLKNSLSINFDDVQSFEVWIEDASAKVLTEVKKYVCINLPCRVEPVNVVWLDRFGGVSSFTFINPQESKTITRNTIQANQYANYSISTGGVINAKEKTYDVSQLSTYTLTTTPLNDWEYVYLSDMLSSEQVYVELTDGTLYPIKLSTTSVDVKRRKYATSVSRFELKYEAESNLNVVPDTYISFSAGLSQVGFSVPTLLSTPSKYFETTIGDGTSLYYVVNHNLNSMNIAVDLVLVSNGQTIFGDVVRINANTVSVEFGEPVATSSIKVMISKLD
jgi:hypothetical protein